MEAEGREGRIETRFWTKNACCRVLRPGAKLEFHVGSGWTRPPTMGGGRSAKGRILGSKLGSPHVGKRPNGLYSEVQKSYSQP